ncbi:MAG: carboxypeptidase regulatory-like domain-containing protein, partial [Gemmatimonadota bacterium]
MRPAIGRWALTALVATVPVQLSARQVPDSARATLRGTVFDSLAGARVGGARVILGDGVAEATTDAQGRFELRAPPGRYPVTFRARGLSAWPMLANSPVVDLKAGSIRETELATASPGTVLARACDGTGSVVGGQVLDLLTLVPLAAAAVDVDVEGAGLRTVRPGADGSWFVCVADGVPSVEASARLGEARSRRVALSLQAGTVVAHDLYLRVSRPAQVQGNVRDGSTGAPLADVTVRVEGTRLATVTGVDGTFRFRGVPPGELRISVARLGYGARTAEIHVEGGSTAQIGFDVFPEAIALDSVVVRVSGGYADPIRQGTRFDGMDRPAIEKLLPRTLTFDDLLRNANIPGLKVKEIWLLPAQVPGVCVETARRSTLHQDECQMVEVYLNDVRISDPETFLLSLPPESVERFQLLPRLEAGLQYMGTPGARNGVLLIWT